MKISNKLKLFGRTRGRSNKKFNLVEYQKKTNELEIGKFDYSKNYILDIGTGYGETSIYLAKKYKKDIVISCEKYIDGNLNLIKNISYNQIQNIKLYPGNVYDILDNIDIKEYFKLVWIFFPDPWPKKKHFKRRLISSDFLTTIHKFLKIDGKICIATDSVSYNLQILNSIYQTKKIYEWTNQNRFYLNIKDCYNLETKFYKKAIICGRNPSLFILKKI